MSQLTSDSVATQLAHSPIRNRLLQIVSLKQEGPILWFTTRIAYWQPLP